MRHPNGTPVVASTTSVRHLVGIAYWLDGEPIKTHAELRVVRDMAREDREIGGIGPWDDPVERLTITKTGRKLNRHEKRGLLRDLRQGAK